MTRKILFNTLLIFTYLDLITIALTSVLVKRELTTIDLEFELAL